MFRVMPIDDCWVVEQYHHDPITNEEIIKVFDEVFYDRMDAYKFLQQVSSEYMNRYFY